MSRSAPYQDTSQINDMMTVLIFQQMMNPVNQDNEAYEEQTDKERIEQIEATKNKILDIIERKK